MQEARHSAAQTHPRPSSSNPDWGDPTTATLARAGGAEERDSVLEVLVAHEDIPAGLRAKQVLDHLAEMTGIKLRFEVKLWTFRVLRDPVLHKYALNEACSAHVLFLSLQGSGELPPAVCALTDGWLAEPKKQPRALVVSFDESLRKSAVAITLLDNLRKRAGSAGVDLFPCFGAPPPVSRIKNLPAILLVQPGRSLASLGGRRFSGRAVAPVEIQRAATPQKHA